MPLLAFLLPLLLLPASLHAAPNRYAGNLTTFVCDVKTALNEGTLNATNAASLLHSLSTGMGCNTLRVPMLPQFAGGGPAEYPAGYNATLAAASAAGFALYASPMEGAWGVVTNGKGSGGAAEAAYAAFVVAYLRGFSSGAGAVSYSYVSVFNEVGTSNCDADCVVRVVADVRKGMTTTTMAAAAAGSPSPSPSPPPLLYVGPDAEHLDSSLSLIQTKGIKAFEGTFDILSSHNAGGDTSSTKANWKQLVELAASTGGGRRAWSSENPACFTVSTCLKYSTMKSPVDAGVDGLVPWETLGNDVSIPSGQVTPQGADIAKHVVVSGLRR
jgi:hypothetical protein